MAVMTIVHKDLHQRRDIYERRFQLNARIDPVNGTIMLPVGYGAAVEVVSTPVHLGARLRRTFPGSLNAPIIASTITDPVTRVSRKRWLFLTDGQGAPTDPTAWLLADRISTAFDIRGYRGQIPLPTPDRQVAVWISLPPETGLPPFTRLVAHARDIARHM
jgi:hypothetical protein